jgi:hypothetical protein
MSTILSLRCSEERIEQLFGTPTYWLEDVFKGWEIDYGNTQKIYITNTSEEDKYMIMYEDITLEEMDALFDEDDNVDVIEVDETFYNSLKSWFLNFITKNFVLLREHKYRQLSDIDDAYINEYVNKLTKKLQLNVDDDEKIPQALVSSRNSPSRELLKCVKEALIVAVQNIETTEAIESILECTKLLSAYSEE